MLQKTCASLLTAVLVAAALLAATSAPAQGPTDPANLVYPEGTRFPLGLYSIGNSEALAEAAEAGWTLGHTYGFKPDYLDLTKQAGWLALAHLTGKTKVEVSPEKPATTADAAKTDPQAGKAQAANAEEAGDTGEKAKLEDRPQTEEEAGATIAALAAYDNLAWWDFPEELRYWYENEYDLVKNLSAWTRQHDPRQRPNYMYQPGHSSAERVAKYVPYLDIIGAGTYTEYTHQPRAWVRWRTEECIKGIALAGCEIGPDYKNGQKTPIGIPMLFYDKRDIFDVITPAEAHHDFWSCLASGAKGILVFSYWHKRDLAILQKTWEHGYKRAAANLMSDGKLDQAILFGEDVALQVEITKGSPRTVAFRPYGVEEDISYPSVNVLAKAYEGTLYVIAVSSQERPVTATISGLPAGLGELEVLFEDRPEAQGGNKVAVTDGAVEDSFGWLGVHVYRAAMP